MILGRASVEVQKVKPQEVLQILHSVMSERGPKTNPDARYFLYPFVPSLILVLLHPGPFTGFTLAVYMAYVSE